MEGQPPPEPERAQLDGVPAFFAELPGAFSAAVMFRTGRSDEPNDDLKLSGIGPRRRFGELLAALSPGSG